MSIKLELNLNQRLILSQKMRQSLSILSLSHEELQEAIQKELLENPFLETVESYNYSIDQTSGAVPFRMFDTFEANKTNFPGPGTDNFLPEQESLKSYVLKQAEMSFFSKKVKAVLPFLISYLDDRAYLNLDLEELAETENIPLDLLSESLKALQSFEPLGVGGRDLKECLLIQLRHKKENSFKAQQIVKYYLPYMKEEKYPYIAGELNISIKETLQLCRLIQSLEPNPARNFSSQPTVFARPDLYIYKQGKDYHVISNKEDMPELKLSYQYKQFIKPGVKLKAEEKQYLKDKTSSAGFFIQAVHHRREQIKKIAYYLIRHQRDFFERGFSHLKPLKMQDLAVEMSVHVSTISRIVNNKYAYTPQGLMALKSFFLKGMTTKTGHSICISQVKKSIRKWIEEENKMEPLSDEHIRKKVLKTLQIDLHRRSIAQYRSSMNIPSIKMRKRAYINSQNFKLLKT